MGRYSDRYKIEKEEAVSVNTEQSSSGNTGNIQAAGRYRERYEQEKKYQNVADTLSRYTDMYQNKASQVAGGASSYNANAGKDYLKSIPQYMQAQHNLDKLKKEVDKNRDFYGEDMTNAVTQYVDALKSGFGQMRQAQRETAGYMKNFKDESDYNLSRKYAGLSYDDAMAKISEIDKQMQSGSASGMKQSEDKTWLENHYSAFKDANDFNMYRKYGSAGYEDIQNSIAELESAAKSYGTSDSSEQEKINSELAWLKNRASELRITHAAETGWDDKYEQLKSIEEKLSTPVMYRKGTIDYWDGLEERKDELLSEINNADDIITDYSNNEGRMAKEEYDKYIEDNANKSFLGAMGQAVMTGVANVNSSLGEFTDSTLGELFRKIENSKAGQYLGIDLPGEEIGKTNEDARTAAEEQQEKMAVNKLKYNNSMQQAGIDIMQGVGTSIPSLVMSLVTAGMGGSGAVAASTASVASDTKISQMISNYIMNLAKDPQYWMSFAQMEGDTYASAKAEGATDAQASAAALINGTLGSIIEVGSGVETQVGKANSIMNFLRSAAEEGNEEVLQGIWENATKKAIYDHDREIASLSNDDAVLNPVRSLTEWSLGAAAGAVMSGGAAAFNAASGKIKEAKADYANGNAIIEYGSVDALLKAAENIDSDNVSKAAAAVSEQVKSGKVDAESVGRLSRIIGEQSYKNTVSQLKESLSAEGVSDKTARKVLDIAERDMTGQEITSEDAFYINNNKTVKGIYNSYIGPAVTTNMAGKGDYINEYTGKNIVKSGALDSLLDAAEQNGNKAAAELAGEIRNSQEVSAKDVGRLATLMNISEYVPPKKNSKTVSKPVADNPEITQLAVPEQTSEHSWYDDYIPEGEEVTQSIPVREAVLNDGRTVMVKKFNGIDENATVHTDEGDIPVSQIKLTDTADAILNFVRKNKYSAGVANTMLADYGINAGTGTDAGVGAFATAFAHMYNYGRAGFDIKDAYAGVADNVMLYGQYKAAYELGMRDKAAEVKAAQDKKNVKNRAKKEITFDIKEKGSYSDKVSFDDNVDMKEFNGNEKLSGAAKVLSVVSDATGVKVKIFDGSTKLGDRTISAEGIYYDGTVYLNMRAGNFGENAIMRTAAHELTHYIQETSPQMYADLKKAIIDTYYKGSEDTFAGLVREKQDVYKNMSLEEISDEVIADACEMMLKDGSAVNKLMKDNITLGNRIKTWIDAFLDKIKAAFTKAFKGVEVSKSEAYKLMTAAGENINGIQKLWNDALSSAVTSDITEGQAKYSIGKTSDGKLIAVLDKNILDGVDKKDYAKVVKEELKKHKSIYVYGQEIATNSKTYNEYINSKYSQGIRDHRNKLYVDKLKAAGMIEDVIKASCDYVNEKPEHSNFPNFARGNVYLSIGNKQYSADVVVGITDDGKAVFYDLVNMREIKGGLAIPSFDDRSSQSTNKTVTDVTAYEKSISQPNSEVNENLSGKSDTKPQLSIDKLKQYSYEELVKKPDIKVADISTIDIKSSSRQDIRKKILRDGMADAKKYGYTDADGNVFVKVKDSNKNVMISKYALRHGLYRRLKVLGPVEVKIGEILSESVEINELVPKKDIVDTNYVLVGAAQDERGADYTAYFIVNSITSELQSVDVLYSANAKKRPAGIISPAITADAATLTSRTISVKQLLQNVNNIYPDILSESVLRKFGHDSRPEGAFAKDDLYSRYGSSSSLTPRVLLSTMSDMDVENLSKEESEALSKYRDTLNKYYGFVKERAEVGMRLNELKAESNQTADIKDRIKRTQDTLDGMNDKVRETATKLQEMEHSKILYDMYEAELSHTEYRLNLTPRVLLSTMSDMDAEKLSQEELKALSEYRDTLRKYSDFDEKRAAARMRLNELKAESNQTADVKEHIKRTQDTLDRMNTKLKETDAKLQEMEQSDTMRTMYEAELSRTIEYRDVRTGNVIKTEHMIRRAAMKEQRKFYIASQRRRSEKRKKTAIRNQIVKIAGEFDSMLKNPTEKKYVPVNLVRPVIQMLNSVNMDAGQEMRLMKLENKINLETDPAERQRLMDRYTSLYANMENGQAKLAETVRLYSSLENDPVYSHEYDPVIEKLLNELADDIGSTPLYEMTLKQLEHTREVMGALRKTVSDSTKMLASDIKERTDECARKCNLEISSRKAAKGPLAFLQRFKDTMLTPERMFNSIGGYVKNGMMSRLGTMLNNGQLKQTRLMQQGSNIFRELVADDNLKSLNSTKDMVDIGLVDKEGNPVMITRAQMLSIYMHLQSKDNRRHLIYGGLTTPEQKLYSKGKTTEAYNKGAIVHGIGVDLDAVSAKLDGDTELTEDERISLKKQYKQIVREAEARWKNIFDNIEKSLTDYEKKWIEKADYFFNTFCRDNLNETTLELYGFKKARVEKYFPIHSDKDYLDVAPDGLKMDATLENMGFLKNRTGFSKNPVYLEDMTRVIQRQLDSVSRFCGMAIPLRNFKKVYSATYGGYAESVRKTIEKNYGAHAVNYIEKLITDLEGGTKGAATVADKIFNGLRGNTAAAVLTLNLPVTVGQAASYPTAAAEMDWPSLAKAFFRGGRKNWVFSAADRELIAEYTPLLWYRNQGNSTTELGDIQSRSTWYGSNKAVSKIKHFGLDWIQSMDTATVGRLWYAAQYYVNSHNPELKADFDKYNKLQNLNEHQKKEFQKNKDAYYSKVAEVFNKVVENTQPDYTTMQRPDILRSNNALVKQMTMFMTQRLQNFNIVYDAAAELICYSRDAKRGLNGVTKEDVKEKSKRFVRAVVSQMAATATLVAGKAICNFLLHNVKGFRDDDDDITAESIANTLKDQFIESLCANIVGGSELYSLINSIVQDKYYYGIQLSALSSVTDMASHLKNLSDAAESGDKSKITKQIWNLVDDVSKVFGVPVANAKKLYNAGKYHAIDIKNGQFFKFMSDVETSESKKVDGIIESLESGSGTDDINAMVEETAQSIASEYPAYEEDKVHSQAVSKVKAKFTARLKSRYLNGDDNEKDDIVNVMINSGLYGDKDDVADTCMEWVITKLKDEYIRADSMTERNDIRRQLFNTGHWKSLSKLDEYLKGLVSNK